ncbi:MAG: citrate lyase ACP [Candidatus Marinimicrobia bacterium]|nr:citrate lyase ACP [Candidatus Neomarinimicrobiota bacterium]
MSSTFLSGLPAQKLRSDCAVRYTPRKKGPLAISVSSKVAALYGDAIEAQAASTLSDLGIAHGELHIDDFGALPFVIQARIEAAVRSAHPDRAQSSLPPVGGQKLSAGGRHRLRRSRLYIPGVQPKMMVNALVHQADGIILDLEDSVAPGEKVSARLIVRNALRVLDFGESERMVRINQGGLGLEDIAAIVPEPVQLILLPKAETAGQVQQVDARIREVAQASGRKSPVYLMPIIESALGIENAYSIATASDNNVALAIGLEDYTADLGVQRTTEGTESAYARGALVNAARAADLQAIYTVFSDVEDMEGLARSVRETRAQGYDGMGAIHPRQVSVIHQNFAPDPEEIEKAQRMVLAFDEAQAQGLGVVALGSKMLDRPVVLRAQRTVDLAISSGQLKKGWKKAKAR